MKENVRALIGVAMEELDQDLDDLDLAENEIVTPLEAVEEAEEAACEFEEHCEATDSLVKCVEGLESIALMISTEGLKADDLQARRFAEAAIVAQLKPYGLEGMWAASGVSMESISQEDLMVSLEGIISRTWEGIVSASLKTAQAFGNFFRSFYKTALAFSAEANALKKKIRDLPRDAHARNPKIKISGSHFLHIDGDVTTKSIVKGFENLTTVNRKAFPTIIENTGRYVKNFYVKLQETYGKADFALNRVGDLLDNENLSTKGMGSAMTGTREETLKVATAFVDQIKREFEKTIGAGGSSTEFSGGRVFDARRGTYHSLPQIFEKNKHVSVHSQASIDTPTVAEMNKILDLVIANGDIIKTANRAAEEVHNQWKKAYGEAVEEGKKIDKSAFIKAMARYDADFYNYINFYDMIRPLMELASWTNKVEYSILGVVKKGIKQYA